MSEVTVITPTVVARVTKLADACLSVNAQTFTEWEHLIIPNDYTPNAGLVIAQSRRRVVRLGTPHPTPGHWNRVLGGLLADTPYVAYLDDDNTWRPRHLEVMLQALRDTGADFAYGKMAYTDGRILGDGRINETGALNNIDASMFVHKTELLRNVATWDPHTAGQYSYAMDGVLVQRWLDAGCSYAWVDEVTVDYKQVGYWIDGGGAA